MDPNRKYLDTKRHYPGLNTTAKHCQNTGNATELLRQDTLGCIQAPMTSTPFTKAAEMALSELPDGRVITSTLLPRTDTPPHVIHKINMDISRSCAAFPDTT